MQSKQIGSTLFATVSQEVRQRLTQAARRRVAAPGEVIVREGHVTNELFIVGLGEMQVIGRDTHGQPQTLAIIRQGESFGELSLLSSEPASATVQAVRESELWVLSHEEFAAAAQEYPELSRHLAAQLGARLREANRRYLRTHRGRLACFVGPEASHWCVALSYRVAASIANHTRRLTAFLDLSGRAEALGSRAQSLRSLADVLSAGLGLESNRQRSGGELLLVTASGEPEELAQLRASIDRLQEVAANLIVYIPRGHPAQEPVLFGADLTLLLLHESEASGSTMLSGARGETRGAIEAVLVSERREPPTVRETQDLQASLGLATHLRSVIPGGVRGFDELGVDGSVSAAAVDRLARSIVGLSIGLALGGGGAKGYAHIGVLRVLHKAGVPFDVLSGCSIGAPLAVGLAAGWSLEDIKGQLDTIGRKAVRLALPIASLLGSGGIRSELRNVAGDLKFEDLSTPVGVVAVSIESGEEVLLHTGPLWQALMASMAYPGIYEPVKIDSRYLVDGGLLNPVPVSAALSLGADVVISSSLAGSAAGNGDPGRPLILRTISRSLEIMQSRIGDQSAARADVEIRPSFTDRPGLLDFKRGKELEEAGARGAELALPALSEALPWLR